MKQKFVQTSNVRRFMNGVAAVDERGAPEASMVLVSGQPGYGKSRCAAWWAIQNDAVLIRLKAACTPHWFLTDLVRELGEHAPASNCEKLFGQAIGTLARQPRAIVLDEVENALNRDITVLETMRDISDMVEVPVILVGREFVQSKLKRHRQLWGRLSARIEFGPATLEDVGLCIKELCAVPVADDVLPRVLGETEGHIREIVNAIKNIEQAGKRNGGKPVTLAQLGDRPLVHDWQRAAPTRQAA